MYSLLLKGLIYQNPGYNVFKMSKKKHVYIFIDIYICVYMHIIIILIYARMHGAIFQYV